ncbi:hypothetical protein [Puniceibacterium sediminis]|uniref:Uncharacterized protein n=1 Tax=Puniceibacterium sediminis TaxID=1608407 RepID=A0A238ZG29_9RHOB|nr:hypothetical protein [Puniceibacterium sediminis]SNR82297.1 hypothetical protein SAMN06265370_1316 [Puniceibacterium sediminis]
MSAPAVPRAWSGYIDRATLALTWIGGICLLVIVGVVLPGW